MVCLKPLVNCWDICYWCYLVLFLSTKDESYGKSETEPRLEINVNNIQRLKITLDEPNEVRVEIVGLLILPGMQTVLCGRTTTPLIILTLLSIISLSICSVWDLLCCIILSVLPYTENTGTRTRSTYRITVSVFAHPPLTMICGKLAP